MLPPKLPLYFILPQLNPLFDYQLSQLLSINHPTKSPNQNTPPSPRRSVTPTHRPRPALTPMSFRGHSFTWQKICFYLKYRNIFSLAKNIFPCIFLATTHIMESFIHISIKFFFCHCILIIQKNIKRTWKNRFF